MARASTKEQIIAAAVETLHQRGFNGTSVQDITEAAKVPKGSFYNHFDSKETLAVEALERYWQKVLNGLAVLGDEKVPAATRLKRYFQYLNDVAYQAQYRTGCLIGNMSAEMPDQSRPVRERLAVLLAAWSRAIESCVREAQADGTMRCDMEAKTIAMFLLNSWEGAMMRAKVDKDAVALTAFVEIAFGTLLT